jgi:hypothetical protein
MEGGTGEEGAGKGRRRRDGERRRRWLSLPKLCQYEFIDLVRAVHLDDEFHDNEK